MKAAAARLMTYWMAEVAVQKLDTNDDQTRILVCMFFILHILVHMLCINGKKHVSYWYASIAKGCVAHILGPY